MATGSCDRCQASFHYKPIHNGFNDTVYAYCDGCGLVGFADTWNKENPAVVKAQPQGVISEETESLVAPCACGGRFSRHSSPRCPVCHQTLDAEAAGAWIENAAPGTAKGWQWQRSWDGLYAIVIGEKSAKLQWRK